MNGLDTMVIPIIISVFRKIAVIGTKFSNTRKAARTSRP